MNNLIVKWIGPVTDRHGVLDEAVLSFGAGKTYEIMLKRQKKCSAVPIATWNVHKVLVSVYKLQFIDFWDTLNFAPVVVMY